MSRITLIRSDDWLVPPHHPPCRARAPHTHTPRHPEAAAHCLQSVMREKKEQGEESINAETERGDGVGGVIRLAAPLEQADLGKICLPMWCCCVTWCSRPKLNMTWTQPLGKHAGLIPVFSSNKFFMRCLSDCLTNWRADAGPSLCHTDWTDLEWRLHI